MNQDTRRLQKVSDDVRDEYLVFCPKTPRFALYYILKCKYQLSWDLYDTIGMKFFHDEIFFKKDASLPVLLALPGSRTMLAYANKT